MKKEIKRRDLKEPRKAKAVEKAFEVVEAPEVVEKAPEVVEKAEKKVVPVSKGFDVEKKIEQIKNSSMPQSQKDEMIIRISAKNERRGNRISFKMYANIKNIREEIRSGMLALPKAKGVGLATLSEWDEIFKDF